MGHSFNSMRHAAFRIKFVTFSKQRFQARHRVCAAIVAAFVVVVLVECVLCNVPFFRSLAASGDSAAAYNTLGPGLERRDDGLLEDEMSVIGMIEYNWETPTIISSMSCRCLFPAAQNL